MAIARKFPSAELDKCLYTVANDHPPVPILASDRTKETGIVLAVEEEAVLRRTKFGTLHIQVDLWDRNRTDW